MQRSSFLNVAHSDKLQKCRKQLKKSQEAKLKLLLLSIDLYVGIHVHSDTDIDY